MCRVNLRTLRIFWLAVALVAAVETIPAIRQHSPRTAPAAALQRRGIPDVCQHRPDAHGCADSTYWVDPE
jgi:hypothetical protein